MLPSALSAVPPMCSLFLISLMILPDGVWMANLAGLGADVEPPELDEPWDAEDGLEYEEPVTEIEFILIAEVGRANGFGEARPPAPTPEEAEGSGERVREEGC